MEFTIDGLDEWQRGLARLDNVEVKVMKERILRKAGMQTLAHLDETTPERSGLLRESMQFGHADNVFQLQVGAQSYVFVGTAVGYAKYVNDGFTQRAGQFVPGYWQNGTFHYVPGEEAQAAGIGGMVLTGKIIPGAHMFEKSVDELQRDLPEIVDFEFRRLHALLFQS